MAYTTFYCNENMLLDHWQDYHESNLMLRNLLKRTSISPIECATIYYERMKNPESVSYDRSHLIQMFSRGRKITRQYLMYVKLCFIRKIWTISQRRVESTTLTMRSFAFCLG